MPNNIAIKFTRDYGRSLMIDHTVACVNSMNSEFEWQQSRLTEAYELMELANAFSNNDGALNEIFEQKKESNSDFGAVFDASGNVVWKSANFSEPDFSTTKSASEFSGIVVSSSGPVFLNLHKMKNGGVCAWNGFGRRFVA